MNLGPAAPHRRASFFRRRTTSRHSRRAMITDRPRWAISWPMTSAIALRLARCFRTSPQFWLGLQAAYDLSVAEAMFGSEIEKLQPIAA